MSRFVRVIVKADAGTYAAQEPLTYRDRLERVAKYVPGEIIALFLSLNGIAATAAASRRLVWFFVAFAVCLLLTPIYFRYIVGTPEDPRRYQATVSTIAFLVWAYGLGAGFFVAAGWYDPTGATFAVAIFSAVSAWLGPTREPEQAPQPAQPANAVKP